VVQGQPAACVVVLDVMPLVVPEHASVVRFDQKILCFRNGILHAK
jgi:hypothetical protein